MFYNDGKSVITGDVILTWDGFSKPEKRDDGSLSYSLRALIHPQAPEFLELQQLAEAVNNNRKNLPQGEWQQNWVWPLGTHADVTKFGPEYQGWMVIGGSTKTLPTVVDGNGQLMDQMHYMQMLYPGCVVRFILNAFDYNNKNKGISFGLEGVMIVDPNATRLPIASGMSQQQVAAAFGGQAPLAGPGQAPGAPGGHVMTAQAAGKTYDEFIAAGWTHEQLVQHGYVQ